MEQVRLNFKCKIIRKALDGFTAVLPDEYVIKFRDANCHYSFDEDDELEITIENIEKNSNDEVREKYAIIYVVLHAFLSNGFLFRDIGQKGFFWTHRGMLTHKAFEKNDYWEDGSLLKIIMKKVSI